jgi:hypothetical protein
MDFEMFSAHGINGKLIALHPILGAMRRFLRQGKEEQL